MQHFHKFLLCLLFCLTAASSVAAGEALERINCSKPNTQAHKLICNDPYLKTLAIDLGRAFQQLRQRTIDQAKPALAALQRLRRRYLV